MDTETLKEKKFIIRFNTKEVVAIIPASGGEIVTDAQVLISTLDKAQILLSNSGINTSKIENYVPVNTDE